ncbi:1,4-dihydroxy-6-naphthoate synthase [Taibaiella soli]|uniref:1,4-dihydroxy-6-naphtoate synthase n=1 Tax=Taibaiella soli TaxID=1649169 RepID=A0A2W2B8B1_9BACT|nr:1,4-dihydroxy-6-naphthoate synthase [Taibaiella soli]PZF72197.1 1,4-dihydroxy-6-naphthoate synthase [Taibaiella soli]
MKLTLGFSPCPNDTFIFDAMVNGKIDTRGLSFEYVLEDVETLNRYAEQGKLDVTKLSYNAFLKTVSQYALLHSGSALGKGVGPMLIAKQPLDLNNIADFKIAIPGVNTTANLLLTLAFPQAKNKTEVVFSEIESGVLDGNYDAGLIIHESRFTYAQKGLHKLIDLGDWWERTMQAAIPLGGIVIRRSFDKELSATVDAVIKDSLAYSWKHYPQLSEFVTAHAQEMEEKVMRQHIELYVNDFTTDLGTVGRQSIETLFDAAHKANLLEGGIPQIFY